MNINKSLYLKESKPLLKELLDMLLQDFSYVSILATDCMGKSYKTDKSSTSISSSFCNERGFVVKIYNGVNYSEYSFNNICKNCLEKIYKEIKTSLTSIPKIMKEENRTTKYKVIEEKSIEETFIKDISLDPKKLGDEEILNRLNKIKLQGLNRDSRVLDVFTGYEFLQINKLFLSKNKDLEQSYMWSSGMIMCMVAENDKNKYRYNGYSGLKGAELLNEIELDIDKLVDDSLELLNAEHTPSGEYDVIFSPEVSGLIAHEAFGHGVEMDMFLKDRAKSKDYLGEYVASPLVTMHDGAKGVEEISSYFFDDEGVLAEDTVIIDKGILKKGMSDLQSSLALNTLPTSNGKRESFERKAYARMTNTYFKPGNDTLEDMISSIKYGFLLEEGMSGMEDPKNWGIQCMLNVAREIKDGKFTGKVYSPVVLTGYVPDLLKSISMISNDLKLYGSGFCGKGYKEWVKVSCGGPYIKAKVRLG